MGKIELPDMKELSFDEDGHIYRLDTGENIPSVTTIMGPLSTAKYKGVNMDVLNRAAMKGTSVHNAIENFVKFGIEDCPAEFEGYFNGFLDFWDKYNPDPIGSEIRLFHRILRYAGTADLLAEMDSKLTLVDFKTTSTLSDMLCQVQLEAYAQALANHGVNVERKMILQLKKDGKYTVREYPAKDARSWAVFGALKTVYDYIQSFEDQ